MTPGTITPKKTAEATNSPRKKIKIFNSQSLFGDADVIFIEHNGETYTLRKTRQEKLILTK